MRVPRLTPDELDAAQRALYDTIAGGPRAAGPQAFPLTEADGSLRGPFNAFLLSPPVGHALQAVGAAVRYESTLSARQREIAILLVAARWNSRFERESHEPIARTVGLDDADLVALAAGDISRWVGDEAVVATTVLALLDGDLDDAAWTAATTALGVATVFDLTTLVGYYATLALQLRVFRVAGATGADALPL